MGWGEIAKLYGVKVNNLKKANNEVATLARARGVDVTNIGIHEESNSDGHRATEYQDSNPNVKNGKKNHKFDNDKGNSHNNN
jgi:hypothetical protein